MMPLTRGLLVLSSVLLMSSTASAQLTDKPSGRPSRSLRAPGASAMERPVNLKLFGTRAIVACDPVEQSCGMAVISFPSGVSGLVPYGRSDLAVATMALPSVDDATAVISRIDAGEAPQAAIDTVLASDPLAPIRQLAAVKLHPDGSVTVGQRTGAENSPATCSVKGATYVVQANNMTTSDICRVMAEGFDKARGSLPQRLYASLKAGARVGGDRNGERSGVIRVWNSTNETAFFTHVLADAVVHGSSTALRDLEVELNRYQGTLGVPYPSDLVVLDRDTVRLVKRVLRKLDYYDGPMDGTWPASAEQALADFNWNNIFFDKPTVVVDGVRKIDGVLVKFMRDADLDALLRAGHFDE
ncbi:DUF1028 domain-containing protein [Pyxidicoccus xibeiensis]|uniref:DUF1028 domain-containing protein n=1 Tax=Pyxidicoccus xibeiensis TaxID=2906759 RepID=UPI0020A7ED79|nr:DUF1028 domain-containing protein [Pyxidicoccus xibeiensis]MCP3136363.1 DUF1028 domain-containing protein [Pyxidicoccus xibeiensis]